MANQFVVAHIIPTGVGADIGGYVGDATPATNMIASIADKVISHPNVVNGVALNLAGRNVLYVEGYSLDRFFKGEAELKEVEKNKIGVVLDKGIETEGYDLAVNTINALRTVGGVEIVCVLKTKEETMTQAVKTKSNSFVGEIEHEQTLIEACREAIKQGAQALAISLNIKIDMKDLKAYFDGKGANPYGGAEAVVSHLVSATFGLPAAHAPLLSKYEIYRETHSGTVDPRAAAEAIGPAYLGSVLRGLDRAPRLVTQGGDVRVDDVDAIILPYTCMGGIPALAAQKWGIPIIAVKENTTVMKATPDILRMKNVVVAENYWETGGILAAMKEGIDPLELRRPVKKLTIA
ncbi:DUF3326 domain-containing protein [Candidatus Kuenenia sp.]|uniref:DUF3326 domain-containing protein n=1 Tax=Candidatus Kuenenia sp. TaxID=2499824 RepID=UPI00321FF997